MSRAFRRPADDQAPVVDDEDSVTRVVIHGCSTAHGLAMLRLELERLAKSCGAEITTFSIEREEGIDLLT
jgi:hypothetical protein